MSSLSDSYQALAVALETAAAQADATMREHCVLPPYLMQDLARRRGALLSMADVYRWAETQARAREAQS